MKWVTNNLFLRLLVFVFLNSFYSNSYAQKSSIEFFANPVIDLPYKVMLNGEESQQIDILKNKNNYELGIGYNYNLIAGLQPGIDFSYGNKDLNFTSTDFIGESDYQIKNVYLVEDNFRLSLKISYQVAFCRASFGYGMSYNNINFKEGSIQQNYHYLRAPVDLMQAKFNNTLNQFYTLQIQFLPKISDKIHLGCGLKYLHNFEQQIVKDIFVIQHSYFLINLGIIKYI